MPAGSALFWMRIIPVTRGERGRLMDKFELDGIIPVTRGEHQIGIFHKGVQRIIPVTRGELDLCLA